MLDGIDAIGSSQVVIGSRPSPGKATEEGYCALRSMRSGHGREPEAEVLLRGVFAQGLQGQESGVLQRPGPGAAPGQGIGPGLGHPMGPQDAAAGAPGRPDHTRPLAQGPGAVGTITLRDSVALRCVSISKSCR